LYNLHVSPSSFDPFLLFLPYVTLKVKGELTG
jgi:hypothetical protein